MKKIQWRNKFSGEQGFVKKIHLKDGYFENTFEEKEAKAFADSTVKRTIKLLESYSPDNVYQPITFEK